MNNQPERDLNPPDNYYGYEENEMTPTEQEEAYDAWCDYEIDLDREIGF